MATSNEIKTKRKRFLKYAIFGSVLLAIGIYFLITTFNGYDLNEIMNAVSSANLFYVFVGLGFSLLSLVSSGGSFFVVLNSLGQKLSYPRCFKYACAFLFFGNVTPAAIGSQPITAMLIGKDKGKVTESVVAMFLHILIFKMWLVIFGIVAMVCKPHLIFGNLVLTLLFLWGMIFNLAYVAFCAMAIWAYALLRRIGCWFIEFFYKIKIVKQREKWLYRFTAMMQRYREASDYVKKHPTVTLKMAGFVFVQRVCAFSIAYFSVVAFGVQVDYFSLLLTQIVIVIAVESLPFPGGIGVAETVSVDLFSIVVMETAYIVPSMVLNRGLYYYGTTIICAIVVLIGQIFAELKRKKDRE